jgi:hypothetical protein
VTWRRRLAVSGAALCVFAWISAGHSKWLAVLVSGVPFLVAGVMLLLDRKGIRAGPSN